MSEFYANCSFLERKHFFTKYYLLIKDISFGTSDVESIMNKLKNYNGFGIEEQIANLKKCSTQLRDYKEDVRTEFYSLVKIVDIINDYENRANGILGDTALNEKKYNFILKEYDNEIEAMSFSSAILNAINSFFDNITQDMGLVGYLDYMDGGIEFLSDLLDFDYPDMPIALIKSLKDIYDMVSGKATDYVKSALSLIKNGTGTIKDVLKKYGDQITDKADDIVSYLNVAGVALTTVYSGYNTYSLLSADGEMSVQDWCLTAIDGSVDGLFTCVQALIKTIAPEAKIVSDGLGFADDTLDLSGKVKQDIRDFAKKESQDMANTVMNNEALYNCYKSSSPVTQNLIMTVMLHPGIRGLVKYFS